MKATKYQISCKTPNQILPSSGSEGTGNGSDEDDSKGSNEGEDSDSDAGGSADEEAASTEETKGAKEDLPDEDKFKDHPSSEETSSGNSRSRKKAEKASDPEPDGAGGAAEEVPKKWNLRRNRPMLDFTTMEHLNVMDDYDSEDDNDWRPTTGKKKNKVGGKEKAGSEDDGDEAEGSEMDGGCDDDDDDVDEEDGDDDDDDDDEDNEQEDDDAESSSSTGSEAAVKKPKKKANKSATFDEEETNDSHSTSHGKGNEVGSGFVCFGVTGIVNT